MPRGMTRDTTMLQARADMRSWCVNGGPPAVSCRTACGGPDAGGLRPWLEHTPFTSPEAAKAPYMERLDASVPEALARQGHTWQPGGSTPSAFPNWLGHHGRRPLAALERRCALFRWVTGQAPSRDAGALRLPDRTGDDGLQHRRPAAACAVVGVSPLRVPPQRRCHGPWPEQVGIAFGCPLAGKSSVQ